MFHVHRRTGLAHRGTTGASDGAREGDNRKVSTIRRRNTMFRCCGNSSRTSSVSAQRSKLEKSVPEEGKRTFVLSWMSYKSWRDSSRWCAWFSFQGRCVRYDIQYSTVSQRSQGCRTRDMPSRDNNASKRGADVWSLPIESKQPLSGGRFTSEGPGLCSCCSCCPSPSDIPRGGSPAPPPSPPYSSPLLTSASAARERKGGRSLSS
mmetsp:Transcript_43310/g.112587  ORF Transcript_43310/g.112587 Transcript_43310/m.112587 type:complete len:206 (+) Transcript_43310:419-1036(+)